ANHSGCARSTSRPATPPGRRWGRPQPSGRSRFTLADEVEQLAAQAQELGILAGGELVARPRQLDGEDLGDAAGVGVERDDPVAEIDRLVEVVGDEQRGGA